MLTVHHLQFSQSFRALWLLEALGAQYELKIYPRDPKTNLAPADYKALSPLGTAPVITDGGVTVSESNAVIDYILDQHPGSDLRPAPEARERTKYLFWFHAGQGSMMPMLFINMIFGFITSGAPALLRPVFKTAFSKAGDALVKPRMKQIVDQAERDLGEHTWLAGERLTAADISMSYCMAAAQDRGFISKQHPGCLRWLEQMEADPAFQAAKAKDDGREMLFRF